MTPRHHLSEEVLFSYAAGNLSHSFEVVVASHLTLCPVCRERLVQHEEVCGALLECEDETGVASDALESVFTQIEIDSSPRSAPKLEEAPVECADRRIPGPVRDIVGNVSVEDIRWKKLVPGIWQYDLAEGQPGKESLRLLRIAPGMTIPEHTHSGSELTLILSGSYTDEVGRFQAGDVAVLDSEVGHQPISDTHEDCICLIATDGLLRFKGLLPRLLQPVIGL